jgi:hypothetical protein
MNSEDEDIVDYQLESQQVSDTSGLQLLLLPLDVGIPLLWHCAILSFIISWVYISTSIEHSLHDCEDNEDEKRDGLSKTESVQGIGGIFEVLQLCFTSNVLPVYQSQEDDDHKSDECLCEVVSSRLHLLELVCDIWMLKIFPIVNVLLLSVQVLREDSAVEVGDGIKDASKPSSQLDVDWVIIIIVDLLMDVCHQVLSLSSESGFSVFVCFVIFHDIEGWVLVDVVLEHNVVPSSNSGQVGLVDDEE